MGFIKMLGTGLELIKKLVGVIYARSKKKKRKKKYEAKRSFDDYNDKYK